MVHFAIDDTRIKFCTKLIGKSSWFLPFDKGHMDGAGNPPNPNGLMTDYLWKEILTKDELANIIENYAQAVEEKDPETGKTSYKQIFPRYHQLTVVKELLADVRKNGIGQRYLIQHSAGSGKSNSIAWLAHQLVGLEVDGENVVDSVVVVTDRVNLDRQIKNTIKQFVQVGSTVAWAERSGDLRNAIINGKKIIITTVHKFPIILNDIGTAHKNRKFAISQMGAFIAHRLINYHDKEAIIQACSTASNEILTFLPVLGAGEAILTGVEVPMSLNIKITPPIVPPDSKTPIFAV